MKLHESEPKWHLETSKVRTWSPEVSKSEPKGAKRMPIGAKREPKGAKREPKGCQSESKGAKNEPKGAKSESKVRQIASQNSPPGRLRPQGSGEFRELVAFGRTQPLFCAPFLEHFPWEHLLITHLLLTHPFFCLRQHLSLLMLCNYFWVLCWRVCFARVQCSCARPPPHPTLAIFWYFLGPVPHLFPHFFRERLFYDFSMILPPFF